MANCKTDQLIQTAMTPLFFTLKCFGLYFTPANIIRNSDDSLETGTHRQNRWNVIQRVYSFVIFALLIFSTVRYMPSFGVGFDFKPELIMSRVTYLCWYIQCVVNVSIILKYCHNGTWELYFKLWNNAILDIQCVSSYDMLKGLRVFSLVCVLASVGIFLFNIIGMGVMVFYVGDGFAAAVVNPLPVTLTWKVVFIICHIFYSAAWVFTVCLVIIFCKSMRDAFILYTKSMKYSLDSCSKSCPENIDKLRKRHLSLCRLVEVLDKPIRFMLMNILSTNIFLACFILYNIINGTNNLVSLIMSIMWIGASFLAAGLVYWYASTVHDAAHAPLDHIYDIETDNLTTQQLGQLTLFLSKLTGASIGFTAMGLFTVTKEVLLTVGGLYLTYFFLLLQFKLN